MDAQTEKQVFIVGGVVAVVGVVLLARRNAGGQAGGYVPGNIDNTAAIAESQKQVSLAQITADTFKAALGFKLEGDRLTSDAALAGRQSEIARDIAFRTTDRAAEAQIETARAQSAGEIARANADREATIAGIAYQSSALSAASNAEVSRQALELQKAELAARAQEAQNAAQAAAVAKVASAQKTASIFNGIFSSLNTLIPLILNRNRTTATPSIGGLPVLVGSGGGIYGGGGF